MLRGMTWLLAGSAVLVLGCQSAPSETPPVPPQPVKAKEHEAILAVSPIDQAASVSLTPTFKWKLPGALGIPTNLSFTLVELGPGETPPKEGAAKEKQIAFCSGLHDTSPTALDLFHPPAGSILTGEVRSMQRLQPDTWYRWTVRVIGDDVTETGEFVFKTQGR